MELLEEWAREAWNDNPKHELSLEDEIDERLAAGQSPEDIARSMASEIGDLEGEVIVEQPDMGKAVSYPESDVESHILHLASRMAEKRSSGTADSYMPTDDATNVTPSPYGGDVPDQADGARFQTRAAAKERALGEGFDMEGRRLRLFEISERLAVKGDTVRWEVRDLETQEAVVSGGPLFLDHPAHSDHALTDARARAYAALKEMCNGVYRDLRGSKMSKDTQDRERKVALLRAQTRGLRLTAAQQAVVADIESQIAELSDELIVSVGGILKQDWDPGSSWEVVEADGASRLVRKETKLDDSAPTKHAFRPGQELRIDSGVVPEDVVVREALGQSRYKVQSTLSHAVFEVDERDLYDASRDGSMFEGPGLDIGDIAQLF